MNIRQLHYFLAVARELNFTRAAERVHIAQPPLSQQIIALERELGTALFIREKRHVKLTPAGEILVEHAHRVINAAAAAVDAVRLARRGAKASISVGAIYSAIHSFLPDTLRNFNAVAPNVEISVREMTIAQQLVGLREGAVEVGLLRGPLNDRDLRIETLYHERLVVAAPANSPFDSNSALSIKDLADYPLIAVPRSAGRTYSDRVLDVFETHGVQPRIVHEVWDMHTSMCLVAAGLGAAIVPAMMQTMPTSTVRYCQLAEPTPGVSFAVALRPTTQSPMIDAFIEAARKSAASMLQKYPELFLKPQAD